MGFVNCNDTNVLLLPCETPNYRTKLSIDKFVVIIDYLSSLLSPNNSMLNISCIGGNKATFMACSSTQPFLINGPTPMEFTMVHWRKPLLKTFVSRWTKYFILRSPINLKFKLTIMEIRRLSMVKVGAF